MTHRIAFCFFACLVLPLSHLRANDALLHCDSMLALTTLLGGADPWTVVDTTFRQLKKKEAVKLRLQLEELSEGGRALYRSRLDRLSAMGMGVANLQEDDADEDTVTVVLATFEQLDQLLLMLTPYTKARGEHSAGVAHLELESKEPPPPLLSFGDDFERVLRTVSKTAPLALTVAITGDTAVPAESLRQRLRATHRFVVLRSENGVHYVSVELDDSNDVLPARAALTLLHRYLEGQPESGKVASAELHPIFDFYAEKPGPYGAAAAAFVFP